MRRLTLVVMTASALAVAGCSEKEPARTAELKPVEAAPHPIVPLPDPEEQGGHIGRAPRRITVSQLERSIEVATGQTWSQLDARATSLGKADYALVNTENTEPTLVFAKFLEDGAREVCIEAAKADLTKTTPAERVLSREIPAGHTKLGTIPDADVQRNLTYLSTRFWGVPLQGAELESWTTLFKNAATRADTINKPDQAWAIVCIGLMTDPRFITY